MDFFLFEIQGPVICCSFLLSAALLRDYSRQFYFFRDAFHCQKMADLSRPRKAQGLAAHMQILCLPLHSVKSWGISRHNSMKEV